MDDASYLSRTTVKEDIRRQRKLATCLGTKRRRVLAVQRFHVILEDGKYIIAVVLRDVCRGGDQKLTVPLKVGIRVIAGMDFDSVSYAHNIRRSDPTYLPSFSVSDPSLSRLAARRGSDFLFSQI